MLINEAVVDQNQLASSPPALDADEKKYAPNELRIEFSVREPESGRFVTFGDDVNLASIRDWFVRCSLAVENLFNAGTAARAIALDGPVNNKILCIKLVRELTGAGLREAKDAVEQPIGWPLFACEDGRTAAAVIDKFRRAGISVRTAPVDLSDFTKGKCLVASGKNLYP